MSEARRKPTPEPSPPEPFGSGVAADGNVRLDVTAQLITLAPGMFSVELEADGAAMTETGMVLPTARLDALPPLGEARAWVDTLSDSSLLLPGTHPAFVRVAGGEVAMLLTIYKLAGGAPPRLRVTAMPSGQAGGARAPAAAPAPRVEALPSLPVRVTVHVSGHGDVTAGGGMWAEAPDGTATIEGLSILPQGVLAADAIEYQAILGQDWVSPWMGGGEFCGSRQLALALLGVRVRLRGAAADTYRCQVWGRFDGAEAGPFDSGESCELNGAALQGLRVAITEKPVAVKPKRR
jgi:hypothetical protein